MALENYQINQIIVNLNGYNKVSETEKQFQSLLNWGTLISVMEDDGNRVKSLDILEYEVQEGMVIFFTVEIFAHTKATITYDSRNHRPYTMRIKDAIFNSFYINSLFNTWRQNII